THSTRHLRPFPTRRSSDLHTHLGIYGTMRLLEGRPEVAGQVRWRLTDGENTADLRGPNTCALLDPAEGTAVIDRLGPDPLRPDRSEEHTSELQSRFDLVCR